MIKKVLLAVAVLGLTAIPFLSEVRANDEVRRMQTGTASGGTMMEKKGAMPGAMMAAPEHQMMKAYHQNVIIFARALERVARQGETVQPQVARAAIFEMRRSTDEMEKYRAGVMAGMPEAQRGPMQKMMDEHLVKVKTHLRQLEDLSRKERIPSLDVITHLDAILEGGGMPSGMMHGRGMYGTGMRGGCGACYDNDCPQCNNCPQCSGCPHCPQCSGCPQCQGMQGTQGMSQHRQMMQQMTQTLKAQDAELMQRVEQMKRAPRDKKVDHLADIVSTIVQQRAAVTAQMEQMQRQSMDAVTAPGTQSTDGACVDEDDVDCDDAE